MKFRVDADAAIGTCSDTNDPSHQCEFVIEGLFCPERRIASVSRGITIFHIELMMRCV